MANNIIIPFIPNFLFIFYFFIHLYQETRPIAPEYNYNIKQDMNFASKNGHLD